MLLKTRFISMSCLLFYLIFRGCVLLLLRLRLLLWLIGILLVAVWKILLPILYLKLGLLIPRNLIFLYTMLIPYLLSFWHLSWRFYPRLLTLSELLLRQLILLLLLLLLLMLVLLKLILLLLLLLLLFHIILAYFMTCIYISNVYVLQVLIIIILLLLMLLLLLMWMRMWVLLLLLLLLHLYIARIPLDLLDNKLLCLTLISLTQTGIKLVKVIHYIHEVILVL